MYMYTMYVYMYIYYLDIYIIMYVSMYIKIYLHVYIYRYQHPSANNAYHQKMGWLSYVGPLTA